MMFSLHLSPTGPPRLSIEGELDATTVGRLEPTLKLILSRCPTRLEIDVSRLRMIDSTGVGQLIAFGKRLKVIGCSFIIAGLRDQPLAVFRLLRFDKILAGVMAEAVAN